MTGPILTPPAALSPSGRLLVLTVAFLGWLCAGFHMAITQQVGRAAAIDLLSRAGVLDAEDLRSPAASRGGAPDDREVSVARWFAWTQCAFLFGAAAGG